NRKAVVAESRRPRVAAEVLEVRPAGVSAFVFVIPEGRPRPELLRSPRWVVALAELLNSTAHVRVVAEREHRSPDSPQQLRGLTRRFERVAHRDVAGADEN